MRPPPTLLRRAVLDPVWLPLATATAVLLLTTAAVAAVAAPLTRRRRLLREAAALEAEAVSIRRGILLAYMRANSLIAQAEVALQPALIGEIGSLRTAQEAAYPLYMSAQRIAADAKADEVRAAELERQAQALREEAARRV